MKQRHRYWLRMVCLAALVALTACATVNSTERVNAVGARQVVQDRRIVTDRSLNDRAGVVSVNLADTPDGFLKVQVELHNFTDTSCRFRYSYEWFDRQGMLIHTATPSWLPRQIHGGESLFLVGLAPTPESKDFRLKLVAE